MKYTGDKTSERERERANGRSSLDRRDAIVDALNIGRIRENDGAGARGSRRREPGAPRGTENTVVVLRVPGERNVREKHIADVPTAVNFLRAGRNRAAKPTRFLFIYFPSGDNLTGKCRRGFEYRGPDGNRVPISLIAR